MFQKMRIAARLLCGFGVLTLLLAGIVGYSVYSGRATQSAVADMMHFKTNETLNQQVESLINKANHRSLRFRTRLVDISDGGAKVAAVGDRITLEFEDRSRSPARIVWIKDGHAGMQFDRPLSQAEGKAA
jgi:hypothetical protein